VTEVENIRVSVVKSLYNYWFKKLEKNCPEFAKQVLKNFVNQVILPEINTETGGYSSSVNKNYGGQRLIFFS